METAQLLNLPKIEKYSELDDQWLLLEDQLMRPMEVPLLPPSPITTTTNLLLEYHSINPTLSSKQYEYEYGYRYENEYNQGVLDTIGADFDMWSECPPLCEEAWKPLSQISPPIPLLESSSNQSTIIDNDHENQMKSLNNNDNVIVNDQSLSVVVAEGFTKKSKGDDNHVLITKKKENGSINTKHYNNNHRVSKIESLQYDEIRKYFDVPISKAAKELNVGLTVLKKRCRELNIKRWPHRKIKSLQALISNVKEMGMVEMAEELEEHRRKLQMVPEMELTAETKKLRQACFKANYKKRRAMALNYSFLHY